MHVHMLLHRSKQTKNEKIFSSHIKSRLLLVYSPFECLMNTVDQLQSWWNMNRFSSNNLAALGCSQAFWATHSFHATNSKSTCCLKKPLLKQLTSGWCFHGPFYQSRKSTITCNVTTNRLYQFYNFKKGFPSNHYWNVRHLLHELHQQWRWFKQLQTVTLTCKSVVQMCNSRKTAIITTKQTLLFFLQYTVHLHDIFPYSSYEDIWSVTLWQ